jgi:hypothetical protein
MRQGTHPALLEELTAPRWHRQHQQTLDSAADVAALGTQSVTPAPSNDTAKASSKKNKKGRQATSEVVSSTRTGLKLRLKRLPASNTTQNAQVPVSQEEELFCICNKPSSGFVRVV